MAETRPASGRARSKKEEEYFLRAEAELLEKVRVRAAKEAERKAMGEQHGVEDPEILAAFEDAGYDRHTVRILHLVPILQIAWVDGEISKAEREEILRLAAARGVVEGSPAHVRLLSWLDAPPSPEFFERTMAILARLIEALPEEREVALQGEIMTSALKVASASGGFLGLGSKVSAEEKALLAHFAESFEKAHKTAVEKAHKKG
jgi:hypothetical protein